MGISERPFERLPYLADLLSWSGIGWITALLIGLWGVMIGIGKFGLSEVFLLISGAIVLMKVGVETLQHQKLRRWVVLAVVLLFIVLAESEAIRWTTDLSRDAEDQQKRLRQLDDIPLLKGQLNELPVLQEKVNTLEIENKAANSSLLKKERIIEGLAQTVIAQNKAIGTDVLGAGYAAAYPDLGMGLYLGGSQEVPFFLINYGRNNLYEVRFEVEEAIGPSDSLDVTLAKIKSVQDCTVGTLYPMLAHLPACKIRIAPEGGNLFCLTVRQAWTAAE